MANFHHSKGGPQKTIIIGDFETILNARELDVSVNLFMIGSFMFLSLFFLGLHLYWKKDSSTLYLAIFSFLYGFRYGVYDLHLLTL